MKRRIPHVFLHEMHGTKSWIMDGRYHGGKREYFPSEGLARTRAEELYGQIFNVDIKTVAPEVVIEANRGAELLKAFPGATLLKACEFYANSLKSQPSEEVTMQKAADDWLAHKTSEGLSGGSLSNHKSRLKSLCARFGAEKVHQMTYKTLHPYFHGLEMALASKADHCKTARELFDWCIFPNEWIEKNPCKNIAFNIVEKEVKIFTLEEAAALLKAAKAAGTDILRYVVLCMFCGLRPESEAPRILRENIREKDIRVPAKKTRTKSFRYVNLEAGVKRALKLSKWKEGTWKEPNFLARWNKVRASLGYRVWTPKKKWVDGKQVFYSDTVDESRPEWPHDVMRHTYCSYHLGAFQNEALTAHMAGHTVKVLRKNYRCPIDKTEGKAFWELLK